ncbi:MAG TPA: hypothetical protein VFN36_03945 [Solirubrobacteraceae bacterium]|nr:hypothetical protein [Solirubrobacteraceae bacterium]
MPRGTRLPRATMTDHDHDHDHTRDRERRVVELLHRAARDERAPDALHARVSVLRAQADAPARRARRPWPALGPVRFALPLAGLCAAAIGLALGGGGATPSVAQAAALATRPPTAPAPVSDPQDPQKLLATRVGTLHFPNWAAAGGWRAVGRRADRLGDRTATTVYYAHDHRWVVYSIISSPALPATARPTPSARSGPNITTLSRRGRVTVVWTESGHTCLLTGSRGMSVADLTRLAFHGFRRALVQERGSGYSPSASASR